MTNQLPTVTKEMVDTSLDTRTFKAKLNNEFRYLSNFYPYVINSGDSKLPQPDHNEYLFEIDGIQFHSVEQYYQYQKYLVIEPCYAEHMILLAGDSALVKKISGKGFYVQFMFDVYKPYKPKTKVSLKDEFDVRLKQFYTNKAIEVMRKGLEHKFKNKKLKNALLNTYPYPLSERGRFKKEYWTNTGSNALGILLMELRLKIKRTNLNKSK